MRTGVRVSRSCLVVHARTAEPPTRVGLVVSKAVGNAVVRNRVKRRLRHSLRSVLEAGLVGDAATPSLRVVVRALPRSAEASFADLDREVSAAWRQAGQKLLARAGGGHQ